jgi:glycine/D-amino acid oxidase-like deaminating enzyme
MERIAIPGARLVDAREVSELEPELTGPVHGASLFPGDLQCDPRAIARALAREAQVAGATVREGCAVDSIGQLHAGAVVIAAGTWSAPLAASAGITLPLEPRKGQLVRLAAPVPDLVRHKVVDGSYLRSVASAAPGLQLSTVVETTWDGDVLVGSSRERRGFDTSVDAAVSDALVARAARLFPRLPRLPVAGAWAGLRPWLPGHLPAIGPSRVAPGVWLATGHEGAGVALGPVTGRLIAQLYCGEEPVVDPAPFDPDRFAGESGPRPIPSSPARADP